MRTYKKRLAYPSPRPHSHISLDWSETHPSNPMANKLLLFVQFVAIATIASCFTVADKRATGGYVQNTSGGASFTHYSGCSQPGMCSPPHPFLTPNAELCLNLSKPISVRRRSKRIHRRREPAHVRVIARPRARGRVRPVGARVCRRLRQPRARDATRPPARAGRLHGGGNAPVPRP